MRFFLWLIFSASSLACFAETAAPTASSEEATKKEFYAYFKAPEKWSLTAPTKERPHVKIAFFDTKAKGFKPSINLAQESIKISLNDYLKAVKALHEANPNKKWRKIGKVNTQSGEAILTQIDMTSEWGVIRMYQAILVKEGVAYIINAAAPKDKITDYLPSFQEAFQSFTVTDDLLSVIEDAAKKEKITSFIEKIKTPKDENPLSSSEKEKKLEEFLSKEFSDLGPLWQSLVIQQKLK